MAKQNQRKRAGHGEGSVYQRKDGRWVGEITLEDGSRKPYYGKTRKEAYEKKEKALQEQRQGTLATGPQQKLKDSLEYWLEEVHKPTIRVSSYVKYRRLLHKHILPTLGHIQMQKLTPEQVHSLYTRKLKEGLSARTVLSMHGLLHKALDNAVRWGRIARNVCDVVSPPHPSQRETQPLSKEQAQKLLETARGHRLEALLTVALTTGMRRGELLGLRWQDINFDDGSLQIRRSMNRIEGNGVIVSEPKTPKSRRNIILPHFVLEVLKQHRIQQVEARLKAGIEWQENDLVFCNIYGRFLDPNYLLHLFHKLLKDAELPQVRFHDLRHSAATILLTMGVHPKMVQELLGHSQIGMTMDTYSHVLPSMQRGMMDKWDELFGE